jgi:vancomycin resistance protein YoaR
MAIFVLLVLLAGLGGASYVSTADASVIAAGVHASHVDLAGLRKEEAVARLREATEKLTITFVDRGTVMTMMPASAKAVADGPVATYDVDAAVTQALAVGKDTNPFLALVQRIRARVVGVNVRIPYELDEARLTAAIEARFGLLTTPATNARLAIAVPKKGAPTVSVTSEADGSVLNEEQILSSANDALRTLTGAQTQVTVTRELPLIRATDVEPLAPEVAPLLARLPLRVTAGEERWTVDAAQAAPWIIVVKDKDGVRLGLEESAVRAYLQPRADMLAVKPVDAVFTEKDGRVTEFVPSVDGTMLDMQTSVGRLTDAIMVGTEHGEVDLPIVTDVAKVQTNASNPYGIREIIGVGSSNFRGSPKNRRANIDVGRKSLNGILVHPGEEFSLLTALGPIDGEHGYLEELVIKGNETKPEYGGGLCQIGTTTFRAVLSSGLPVLERRNHSYRVTYYELDGDGNNIGPGKDATIYEPAPDFRFKNDTATSILIRTYLANADKLVFEFWGTKDGRLAEQTNSVILTSTPPPPKKTIKTTTIPPGTTKCTEKPHPGATAKFTYSVTYPSGEKKDETFMSYYKPWGEVCLTGVTQEELDAAKAAGEVDDAGVIVLSADAAGATGGTQQ